MKAIFNKVDPKNLKNHLLNIKLYGDKPDQELKKLIEENGVLEPIVVTPDNTIISGHRRNQCAKMLGLKEVPVIIRQDLTDPLEIEKTLILSNKQREKTTELKAREYQRLVEIEAEQAKTRLKTSTGGSDPRPRENVPYPEKHSEKRGKASDLAAKEVGMSGKTAQKAAKVVEKIDELEELQEFEKAAELRETLNKSVSGAAKKITPTKPKEPEFDEKKGNNFYGQLIRWVDDRGTAKGKGKKYDNCIKHLKQYFNAMESWRKDEAK